MPNIQLSLTEHGHKLILQQGVFTTFRKFSVTDDGNRYDITEQPNLEEKFNGGLRTLITLAPTCGFASTKSIQLEPPSEKEIKMSTRELEWEVARLDDCTETYVASNPKIVINLRTWFNYLKTKIGPDNYNYNDRLQLSLTDNIRAYEKTLDPSTYEYKQTGSFDNLNISYLLDSDKSVKNYKQLNTYLMTTTNGNNVLKTSTNDKFWSPFLMVADTEEGQNGGGDNWKMSMSVVEWGYVGLTKESTSTVYRRGNFYTITDIESMSQDDINDKFKSLRPACVTSKTNSNSDLFILEDLVGTYREGVDMLPTYTQRFKNSEGQYLIDNLISKSIKFIKTHFKQNETTPGLYEESINLKINNRSINGNVYNDKQIVGGNIEFHLKWDDSSTDDNYDNIVTWI